MSPAPAEEQPVTVLFVDDEPIVLRAIQRALASAPFQVIVSDNPLDVLKLLSQQRIDVLVSDIDMPEMNGLELLRRVRQGWPNVLRMVLTGRATLSRALEAVNEGEVTRIFEKPLDVERFRESMRALAERIAKNRADGSDAASRARSQEMRRWVEGSFPGTLPKESAVNGELTLDVDALARASESEPILAELLRR
jgi:DNA-binding NtrC family response regulator